MGERKCVFQWSWSYDQDGDQDGRHMIKTLKNLLLRNQKADYLETWYAVLSA